MQATFKTVPEGSKAPAIDLFCNSIEPVFVQPRLSSKRYKKVGREARQKLLACVQNGCSIINVAKRFQINYSTAKSIVQSFKKKGVRGEDSQEGRVTGESESMHQLEGPVPE